MKKKDGKTLMGIKESEASEEARRQGLEHVPRGKWADSSGKIVARTVGGRLVPVQDQGQGQEQEGAREQVRQAAKFAIQAHGSQMYGIEPYRFHLEAVFKNVAQYGGGPLHLQAAWLHDVVEDTPFTVEDIEQRFGPEVAEIVDLVTNQETKEETFQRVRTNPDAVLVKLADRLANVMRGEKNKMYRKRHPLFKSLLYKPGEFDELWQSIELHLGL